MKPYLDALREILDDGVDRTDRTGTGTRSIFGMRSVYDLRESFPAMTTKKLAWKAVVSELLWFIEGSGDERRLAEILHGTRDPAKKTIWTGNAEAPYWKPKAQSDGDLGRVYGVQWRRWINKDGQTFDQLAELVDKLKTNPTDRRMILSAWNPGELQEMALPPCHCFAQFYVTTDGRLDCQMIQRSNDFFLGCPFNIASYSLLTAMLAQGAGLKPGHFIHVSGDAHIYLNHIDAVKEQLAREPLPPAKLWLNPEVKSVFDFGMDDIALIDYHCHAPIKAPMAV